MNMAAPYDLIMAILIVVRTPESGTWGLTTRRELTQNLNDMIVLNSSQPYKPPESVELALDRNK
jgi:hypothetical protein